MSDLLDLGKLSFYWRMTSRPNTPENPVPDFVDFSFSFLEEYQLLIQTRNSQTWQYLETIYKENYNVGYLQDGHALAENYGGDFIKFINYAIEKFNPNIKRVSEIGAGGCYILKQLKKQGYSVAAIDPSPIAHKAGLEFGIDVIPDFYPSDREMTKSDMMIHYDVLEHVPDPAAFLRNHKKDLTSNGLILFAVPDCTPYIEKGDISMILHEHLNYYNSVSLENVVRAAGFEPLEIRKADYGGVLYCVAKVDALNTWTPRKGNDDFTTFVNNSNRLVQKVNAFVAEGTSNGNTLGCYIPLRVTPYLSIAKITGGIRFFDDNPGLYQQYFDGFNTPVENFSDLVKKPVSHILIMSFAFGDKIKQKILEQSSGASMKIMSLKDL